MRRRTRRHRGNLLAELMFYVGGLSVLMVSIAGVLLQISVAQRRTATRVTSIERATRVLQQLRSALALADGVPRTPTPQSLAYTDPAGRAVTIRLVQDRVTRTIGRGASARTEVLAVAVAALRFDARADGLIYARVTCRPGQAAPPIAADTLLRAGGPWRRR